MVSKPAVAVARTARVTLFVLLITNMLLAMGTVRAEAPARIVVAWTDVSNRQGRIGRFAAAEPWALETPTLNVGADSTLRTASGLLYAVSKPEAVVAVIDPDTWTVLRTRSVGAGREPVDIAVVASDRAYLSCADETHLLRFNPTTGETTPVVDLSPFADADGIPDLNMMISYEGRLLVQLRRIDSSTTGFAQPAMLAVVDLASEQLIDADPVRPGVQAVELQGTAPKLKMQIVESTRRLFVSASGDYFDDGGIEMVDLDTLQSLGLIVRENEDMVGADLGAFVLVTPDRGYLTYSTDLGVSSHLKDFTIAGGVSPGDPLFEVAGYFATTLPLEPHSNTFLFPDGGLHPSAVHVLDTQSASSLATVEIGASAFPTDVVVIPAATTGPTIPAASSWGVLILALLLTGAAGILLARRPRKWSGGTTAPRTTPRGSDIR